MSMAAYYQPQVVDEDTGEKKKPQLQRGTLRLLDGNLCLVGNLRSAAPPVSKSTSEIHNFSLVDATWRVESSTQSRL
jgi:hypothetical protein